jgi:hypothetical protein
LTIPQVIVATVDYDEFGVEDGGKVHKIYFTDQFSVLNEDTYREKAEEIEGLYQLMPSEGK